MSKPAASGRRIVRNRTRRPALPTSRVTIPMLRSSERGTFKRCRWKWWQEFEESLKPQVDIPPLRFGTLVHRALATYYKPGVRRGPKPADTFEALYEKDLMFVGKEYDRADLQQRWDDAADLGVVMLERYYDRYHPDDEWKVLVTEFPFKVPVEHPRLRTPWFYYTGILDGVWQNRRTGKKVIPDHKTTAAINVGYLAMDPQATAYWTFGVEALMRHGLIAPDGSEHLDGMLFNFLRKSPRSTRAFDPEGQIRNKPKKRHYIEAFQRSAEFDPKWSLTQMAEFAAKKKIVINGDISKAQPAPYHARVPVWRSWYEREGLRQSVLAEWVDMESVRKEGRGSADGLPGAYKNPGQFTCPGCWALDFCELHEIGQDWMEMREQVTRSWDPYAEHEIQEGR